MRRLPEWIANIAAHLNGAWSRRSLTTRFAVISVAILAHGMMAIGLWGSNVVEDIILDSASAGTVLFVDRAVSDRVQELSTGSSLSDDHRRELDSWLALHGSGMAPLGFVVWQEGAIVYNSRTASFGKPALTGIDRMLASTGTVISRLEYLTSRGLVERTGSGKPMLRILVPIFEHGGNRVIAIADTYEDGALVAAKVSRAKLDAWLVAAAIGLAMLLAQTAVVHGGSQLIRTQKVALQSRVRELSRLLSDNQILRKRAAEATMRLSETNERTMRRIGSDLHDGPVQLLGFSVLQVDTIVELLSQIPGAENGDLDAEIVLLRDTLATCLTEVRDISSGLAPTEIEALSPSDMLKTVVRRHQRRTGKPVDCLIENLPCDISFPLKTCLYRMAQEGLNNAFRHAAGEGQALRANATAEALEICVMDAGPGIEAEQLQYQGQGLKGLRDRIEAIGGEFHIGTRPEGGTRLLARFKRYNEDIAHA